MTGDDFLEDNRLSLYRRRVAEFDSCDDLAFVCNERSPRRRPELSFDEGREQWENVDWVPSLWK